MENDATKYPITEDLNALKSAFSGTISSQATEQSAEGSTTTKSTPENLGRNSHEWANKGTLGGVREHILVVERMLGRCLKIGEIVHHQKGDTLDNRPENLVVLTKAQHIRLHNPVATRWARRDLCKI